MKKDRKEQQAAVRAVIQAQTTQQFLETMRQTAARYNAVILKQRDPATGQLRGRLIFVRKPTHEPTKIIQPR